MDQLASIANIANEPFHLKFCKTPLQKHVISIFGQQSSGKFVFSINYCSKFTNFHSKIGKSSLISYLFGNLPVREIGPTSTDDKYTIIGL